MKIVISPKYYTDAPVRIITVRCLNMHRSTKAFLLAPLVPVFLFVTCISAAGLFSGGPTFAPAVAYSAPIWMMFAAPVSYGVAVVFGIPGFILLRRLGWLTMRFLVGGAAMLGLLVGVMVSAAFASDTVFSMLAVTLTFSVFGAVSGYVFWWLSRSQAPNPSIKRDALKHAPYVKR